MERSEGGIRNIGWAPGPGRHEENNQRPGAFTLYCHLSMTWRACIIIIAQYLSTSLKAAQGFCCCSGAIAVHSPQNGLFFGSRYEDDMTYGFSTCSPFGIAAFVRKKSSTSKNSSKDLKSRANLIEN